MKVAIQTVMVVVTVVTGVFTVKMTMVVMARIRAMVMRTMIMIVLMLMILIVLAVGGQFFIVTFVGSCIHIARANRQNVLQPLPKNSRP